MKPLFVGLSPLLKLMAFPPDRKKAELKSRLRSGGHNYYWFMEKYIPLLLMGEKTLKDVDLEIKILKRAAQRTHNHYGILAFLDMWDSQDVSFIPPPEKVFISEHGMLGVKLQPFLAYEENGQKNCISHWNILRPDLPPEIGRLGFYFLNREFPDFKSQLFNLRTHVKYFEAPSWQQAEIQLARYLRQTESIWIEVNKEAEEAARRDKQDDQDSEGIGPRP